MDVQRIDARRKRLVTFYVILSALVVLLLPSGPRRIVNCDAALGRRKTRLVLEGHPSLIRQIFRMEKRTFRGLVTWLEHRGGLVASSYIDPNEKTLIFLYIVCQGYTIRMAALYFGHSLDTIHRLVSSSKSNMALLT